MLKIEEYIKGFVIQIEKHLLRTYRLSSEEMHWVKKKKKKFLGDLNAKKIKKRHV